MRDRWDTIRLLINRQRNKTSACPVSPNLLGQHFSTIADKLNSKLRKTNFEVLNQSNDNNNIHFSFVGVSADIIYDTIRKLDCYRPISILNANKIFERIMHDQLSDHFIITTFYHRFNLVIERSIILKKR